MGKPPKRRSKSLDCPLMALGEAKKESPPVLQGEDRVIATAKHIIQSLGTSDAMADDMLHILSTFDGRFSLLASTSSVDAPTRHSAEDSEESSCGRGHPPAPRLPSPFAEAERMISKWDFDASDLLLKSFIWEEEEDEEEEEEGGYEVCEEEGKLASGAPTEGSLYLEAVDCIIDFIRAHNNGYGTDACHYDHTQNVLQLAMARLEEEFRHILEKRSRPVDPESLRRSTEIDKNDASLLSVSSSSLHGCFVGTLDLLPRESIFNLGQIASRMLACGYEAECGQVFISVRKSVLEESLFQLGLEKLSIEEVQKMPWEVVENEVAKWIRVLRAAAGVLFPSEKRLCELIFGFGGAGGVEEEGDACFSEIIKGSMVQLLNFGEAIAISRRSPERLFRIAEMYEAMRDLRPRIESTLAGPACSRVRSEVKGVLSHLREAARGTFAEFESSIRQEAGKTPAVGGGVHPLTRYVIGYTKLLSEYSEILDEILGGRTCPNSSVLSPTSSLSPTSLLTVSSSPISPKLSSPSSMLQSTSSTSLTLLLPSPKFSSTSSTFSSTPSSSESVLSAEITKLMQHLEDKLNAKSQLYRDPALTSLFLMNNTHYLVQRVKEDAGMRAMLGDDWIRRRSAKVKQHHTGYRRAAWAKVLSCLKDEGIHVGGVVSRTVLKERFKSFNSALEDIIKVQSGWIVSDSQLCTELRLSVEAMLIPAYRAFLSRFKSHLDADKHPERYIKYTPEDLESSLNELFEGGSGSLNKKKFVAAG